MHIVLRSTGAAPEASTVTGRGAEQKTTWPPVRLPGCASFVPPAAAPAPRDLPPVHRTVRACPWAHMAQMARVVVSASRLPLATQQQGYGNTAQRVLEPPPGVRQARNTEPLRTLRKPCSFQARDGSGRTHLACYI